MVRDERLTRERRLRKKSEIDRVFRKGRSGADGLIRVVIRPSRASECRLAVSCPRKVGNSVARTRWKRMIREAFRRRRASFGATLDLVVVPLRKPDGIKSTDVEASLAAIVRRIRRRAAK